MDDIPYVSENSCKKNITLENKESGEDAQTSLRVRALAV